MKFFDEDMVRAIIEYLKPHNELFEVRIYTHKKNETWSGYFKDSETLINALSSFRSGDGFNVTMTLNRLHEGCYSRLQGDCFMRNISPTTSDNDITDYSAVLVDIDPKRPTGISSSEKELKLAHSKASDVIKDLIDNNFSIYYVACSGNGYHIGIKVDFPNNKTNTGIIKQFLEYLDQKFSDNTADIDTTVFNPSRVCKLYGTIAQKGRHTESRPHRLSRIVKKHDDPDEIQVVPLEVFKKYIGYVEPTTTTNNVQSESTKPTAKGGGDSMIEHFLDETGQGYYMKADGVYAITCPFDENHGSGDTVVFRNKANKLCFKCHHNSCSKHGWKDYRKKVEEKIGRKVVLQNGYIEPEPTILPQVE